jgi:hypothetical protein
MSILRALDQFFGTLELAQKYARLFRLDDASLAARGLTREGVSRAYVAEFGVLDAAAAPEPRPAPTPKAALGAAA